jgi:hypothetical protein
VAKFRNVLVGAEKVRSLVDFSERVRVRLWQVFANQGAAVYQGAETKLSGSVLAVRKGRLSRSLKVKPYETEYGFGVRVYSSWYIARFWEKGFGHGQTFKVNGYTRRFSGNDRTGVVAGKSTETRTRIRFRKTASGVVFVKAHQRVINQAARPFLKPSLDDQRGSIRAAVAAAVKG